MALVILYFLGFVLTSLTVEFTVLLPVCHFFWCSSGGTSKPTSLYSVHSLLIIISRIPEYFYMLVILNSIEKLVLPLTVVSYRLTLTLFVPGSTCWTQSNTLNLEKCQVMSFCRSRSSLLHSYFLIGTSLVRVYCTKDLGFHLTTTLSFNYHINVITV